MAVNCFNSLLKNKRLQIIIGGYFFGERTKKLWEIPISDSPPSLD